MEKGVVEMSLRPSNTCKRKAGRVTCLAASPFLFATHSGVRPCLCDAVSTAYPPSCVDRVAAGLGSESESESEQVSLFPEWRRAYHSCSRTDKLDMAR